MQPLPETADYEEHIYAEPYAQPELVVESIEKKLDKKILNIMFQEQKGRKTKVSRQRFDTSV
jgi:hypothetical protein